MKIAIISDIHANLAALRAFPETGCDQVWCLGDLVDYGPNPHEVVRELQGIASTIVCGNHDYAAGFGADPQCSPAYRHLAAETLRYTRSVCTPEDLLFLKNLPKSCETILASTHFYLVHAVPSDPLFAYCPYESDRREQEVKRIRVDVLLVGHTHIPFIRNVGNSTVVNPGSLGQPKTGRPLACYAVWEDGAISLKEYAYPIEETIHAIEQMRITKEDQEHLISVLMTGAIPAKNPEPTAPHNDS